jgi:hypothetical protein
MNERRKTAFLDWASHSLLGHLVFFQIVFTPLLGYFLFLDYSEGKLTVLRAAYVAGLTAVASAVVATLGWYTISRPLIARRNSDGRR